ncbi:MAG: hypothetical protein KGI58_01765 [Patescibacteria group bacterium]|nr:hypothetical protein [Patescibacteria group bacterium]
MKIFYQIAIIIFVCATLYIVKDDVITVYNHAISYISPKANNIATNTNNSNLNVKSEEVSSAFKSVNTPGALQIKDGLALDANSVKLTSKDVIDWTNKNRLINGNLPPLKESSKLDFSAQIKLNDMFKQQYFEHISPNHIGVSDLGDRVSYEYIIIGENLALGNFKDAQSLLNAWMASPGHRANILNKHYQDIGVAVGHGMYKGQDVWMAVQHFGLPRSACPSIDDVLHGTIEIDQNQIQTMQADLALRRNNIDSGVVYEGMTTNEQIAQYNDLVIKYNQLVSVIKEKTAIYNNQVNAFNLCLQSNTQ